MAVARMARGAWSKHTPARTDSGNRNRAGASDEHRRRTGHGRRVLILARRHFVAPQWVGLNPPIPARAGRGGRAISTRLVGKHIGFRLVAFLSTMRSRYLGITYGDQGIYVGAKPLKPWADFPACSCSKIPSFANKRRAWANSRCSMPKSAHPPAAGANRALSAQWSRCGRCECSMRARYRMKYWANGIGEMGVEPRAGYNWRQPVQRRAVCG